MSTEMTFRAISPDLVEENSIRLLANAAGAGCNRTFQRQRRESVPAESGAAARLTGRRLNHVAFKLPGRHP